MSLKESENIITGSIAGTGRRLGRDEDPTSRLASLRTSEYYFRVAHRRRNEALRQNEQSIRVGVTDALRMCM